ncbi:disks large-associated protein 5 isoform X2 [Spodoptera litura]|uniref:Disks large-associated protein 5 isoform X2 n=1 Tax=Spodoptera litura TaxID=69820 RepID=A0A9J7IYP6_SPOLT|nr:disks large-associated protein 5 isoform X2 [Spodoptera litura]
MMHGVESSRNNKLVLQVQKRLENNLKYRKSSRLTVFDNLRNLSKCESPAPVSNVQSKVEHRRQQLEKWKEEKEKKKREAASQKKKPFVAGVPHAPLKFVPPPPPPKPMPSTSGRVTRSQSARNSVKPKEIKELKAASQSFAPKNAAFKPPEIKNLTKLPKLLAPKAKKDKKHNITFDPLPPNSQKESTKQTRSKTVKQTAVEVKPVRKPTERTTKGKVGNPIGKTNKVSVAVQQQSTSSTNESDSNQEFSPILTSKVLRKSLPAPSSPLVVTKPSRKSTPNVTPNKPVPRSESSSEERLRSPKSLEDIQMTPEQIAEEAKHISPCVTMSRGKDNARKEMKKKLDEGLLDEDASHMESVDHFRRQLASEIKRMTEMCDTWDKISEQTVLPESIQEAVLSAVGQARLLMSQKLQQFASLVERCARPEPGTALITPADLHGFWDMVFMQVENVDMRFKKLEELRHRGWVEDQPVEVKKKVVRSNAIVKKAVKPTGGPSRLREMIAAARKAKKEQEEVVPVTLQPPAEDSKTFEAGFFSVRSPVRSPARTSHSPAPRTPASKNSLLKAVLSSEAKKASASKNSASFAMLRASVFGKNVECEGIALLPQTPTPLTPINLYATPGRSILKGANTNTNNKSTRKSIKMVLFNRSDTDIQDVSYRTPDSEINEDKPQELQMDNGVSFMDLEKVENKENSRRKSKLVRQDAEDRSPVVTRSRRKSMNTTVDEDVITPRRSSRKKVLHESEDNTVEEKPKRSTRRRKSGVQVQN